MVYYPNAAIAPSAHNTLSAVWKSTSSGFQWTGPCPPVPNANFCFCFSLELHCSGWLRSFHSQRAENHIPSCIQNCYYWLINYSTSFSIINTKFCSFVVVKNIQGTRSKLLMVNEGYRFVITARWRRCLKKRSHNFEILCCGPTYRNY